MSTLTSPPIELSSWVRQTCWAVTVLALFMQLA